MAGLKFGIVAAKFNQRVTSKLLDACMDTLEKRGVDTRNIEVVRVPGAFEIPLAAKKMAELKRHDAIICLGAVIRGSTPHFDYVASEVSKGVAHVSLHSGVPVIFGVLTTDTIEQAVERAGTKAGNKGFDAAVTAIETANVFRVLK